MSLKRCQSENSLKDQDISTDTKGLDWRLREWTYGKSSRRKINSFHNSTERETGFKGIVQEKDVKNRQRKHVHCYRNKEGELMFA